MNILSFLFFYTIIIIWHCGFVSFFCSLDYHKETLTTVPIFILSISYLALDAQSQEYGNRISCQTFSAKIKYGG